MAELIPPRRSDILTRSGVPTLRHAEFLESLASKTNSNVALTSVIVDGAAVRAQLFALQQQVGSGDFLTSDDTGFTVDSDKLTVDMTEA
jgi:hypothetical protein